MAVIFVSNQTTVAELSKNGQIFVNTTKRAIDSGASRKDFTWEVKISTLSEENIPVICNVEVTRSMEGSDEIVPKKKCEDVEAAIRSDLEAAGYTVMEGVVSEGNTQRFVVPLQKVVTEKRVKAKTPSRKKAKE